MSADTLAEYESQLAEINEMIEAEPSDELLELKQDILRLIAETKEQGTKESTTTVTESNGKETQAADADLASAPIEQSIEIPADTNDQTTASDHSHSRNKTDADSYPTSNKTDETVAVSKKNKKSKKANSVPSTFEIPTHLVPLDSDTEAERNRKRRAIKTLKSKWRERVKESTTTKKQKSWQDFVGKGKKKRKKGVKNVGGSIFKTEDGVNARVGVIGSGKSMTEFGERKRFKM